VLRWLLAGALSRSSRRFFGVSRLLIRPTPALGDDHRPIIDDEGKPRGGLALASAGAIDPKRTAEQGILPGSTISPGIRIGRDGRFRIEGLVPGLEYGASASEGIMLIGDVFRTGTVAPGEVKELGDLKVILPQRDGPL
jgi:hypothetical protein